MGLGGGGRYGGLLNHFGRNMQKHYLKDKAAFDSLSREWPISTPQPPCYPCFICWAWVEGISGMWVTVEYVMEEDFKQNIKL